MFGIKLVPLGKWYPLNSISSAIECGSWKWMKETLTQQGFSEFLFSVELLWSFWTVPVGSLSSEVNWEFQLNTVSYISHSINRGFPSPHFPSNFPFKKHMLSSWAWSETGATSPCSQRGHALSNSLFLGLFCILSSIKLLLQEPKRIFDLSILYRGPQSSGIYVLTDVLSHVCDDPLLSLLLFIFSILSIIQNSFLTANGTRSPILCISISVASTYGVDILSLMEGAFFFLWHHQFLLGNASWRQDFSA